MTKVFTIIGLPCSGKSDYCKSLIKETGMEYISISKIRRELRKENPSVSERTIFNKAYSEVAECIKNSIDCIIDGTFIRESKRLNFLYEIKRQTEGIPFEAIAIIVATPINVCLNRNDLHKFVNLHDQIMHAYMNWQTPASWEGWNEIWIHYDNPEWANMYGEPWEFICKYKDYDLGDKEKPNWLSRHLNKVFINVVEKLNGNEEYADAFIRKETLISASQIHDMGKPIVRTEKDGVVTYYKHSNVGAYESLFFTAVEYVDKIYRSNLIGHHMDPYEWIEKPVSLKSEYNAFIADLIVLNDADIKAKEEAEK